MAQFSGGDNITDQFSVNARASVRAYEAAMLGLAPSGMGGGGFVSKLVQALRPPASGSIATKRQKVVDQLHLLSTELDGTDEVSALLYIFSLNLSVAGTTRRTKLAPSTPYSYVQSFASEFRREMEDRTLMGIDSEPYAMIFTRLLDESASPAPYKIAGLKSFHRFLRTNWNVPSLPVSIFKTEIEATVAADVVWPKELATIECWIDTAPASRFNYQLRAAFSVASFCMIRMSELLVLRIASIVDESDHLCVEIARNVVDGKEKSAEGRRRVTVSDPDAVSQIRKWIERRINEDASPNDYLFGDPANNRKIANPGRMYFWMNQLLKFATGDVGISVHTLRHSVATQKFLAILNIDIDEEVNPLDTLSNEAGHVGGHITTANYCHLFEHGIRRLIDARIHALPISYVATSNWSGISQSTLRKRVNRKALRTSQKQSILWRAVDDSARAISRLDVSSSISTGEAKSPLPLVGSNSIDYAQVKGILTDLANGLSLSQCVLRLDLDENRLQKVVECVGVFAERYGRSESDISDFFTLGIRSLLDSTGELLGIVPNFLKSSSPRWAGLAQAISKSDPKLLRDAVLYWRQSVRDRYLSVRAGTGFDQFVKLLSLSGINANLIEMKWTPQASDNALSDCIEMAQATFRRHLGRTVRLTTQLARGGRPAIWLVIGSDAEKLAKNGSANSIAGLHCLMLCGHVWLTVREGQPENLGVCK